MCRMCYQTKWISTSVPRMEWSEHSDVDVSLAWKNRKNKISHPKIQSVLGRLHRISQYHIRKIRPPPTEIHETDGADDYDADEASDNAEEFFPPGSPPPMEFEPEEQEIEELKEEVTFVKHSFIEEEEEQEDEDDVEMNDAKTCIVCRRPGRQCCSSCVAFLRRISTKSAPLTRTG
jgi:hypothetical protein